MFLRSHSRWLVALYLCGALAAAPLAGVVHRHELSVDWAGCQAQGGEHASSHAPAAAPGISPWLGHPDGAGAPHDGGRCAICHFLSECPIAGNGPALALHALTCAPLAERSEQAVPDGRLFAAWPRAPPA